MRYRPARAWTLPSALLSRALIPVPVATRHSSRAFSFPIVGIELAAIDNRPGHRRIERKLGGARREAAEIVQEVVTDDLYASAMGGVIDADLAREDHAILEEALSEVATSERTPVGVIAGQVKLVLSGDSSQLKPIAASAGLELVHLATEGAVLQKIVRQRDPRMRRAVEHLAHRRVDKAFKILEAQDCIVETGGRKSTISTAVDRWLACRAPLSDRRSADWWLLPSKGPTTETRSHTRNVAAGGPFSDTAAIGRKGTWGARLRERVCHQELQLFQ